MRAHCLRETRSMTNSSPTSLGLRSRRLVRVFLHSTVVSSLGLRDVRWSSTAIFSVRDGLVLSGPVLAHTCVRWARRGCAPSSRGWCYHRANKPRRNSSNMLCSNVGSGSKQEKDEGQASYITFPAFGALRRRNSRALRMLSFFTVAIASG